MFVYGNSCADEIRPGYLQLSDMGEHVFSVVWKVPKKNNKVVNLKPVFPNSCKSKTEITSREVKSAILQSWYLQCESEITGKQISVSGMVNSSTDVLLRLSWKMVMFQRLY